MIQQTDPEKQQKTDKKLQNGAKSKSFNNKRKKKKIPSQANWE